jgi:hypothetical protein
VDRQAAARADVRGDRFAQRKDSLRVDVVRLVVVELELDLLADVLRQREVGLAEVAADDALSGRFDVADERADLERVLGIDAADPVGETEAGGGEEIDGGHWQSLQRRSKSGAEAAVPHGASPARGPPHRVRKGNPPKCERSQAGVTGDPLLGVRIIGTRPADPDDISHTSLPPAPVV